MQVHALMRAARTVRDGSGDAPHLEIMIPLVDYEQEIEFMRALVVRNRDTRRTCARASTTPSAR